MTNASILYPLKILENQRFSGVFWEYKTGTLARKGLIICTDQNYFHLYITSATNKTRVPISTSSSYRHITRIFSVTLSFKFLHLLITFQGKTSRCLVEFSFHSSHEFNITHTDNYYWSGEDKAMGSAKDILITYTKIQEGFARFSTKYRYFSSIIWLPHGQLWAIIKGTASFANVNRCTIQFRPKGHRETRNKIDSLNSAECIVGFEPGTFRFHHNALTH